MKKLITILLSLCMLTCFMPSIAFAGDEQGVEPSTLFALTGATVEEGGGITLDPEDSGYGDWIGVEYGRSKDVVFAYNSGSEEEPEFCLVTSGALKVVDGEGNVKDDNFSISTTDSNGQTTVTHKGSAYGEEEYIKYTNSEGKEYILSVISVARQIYIIEGENLEKDSEGKISLKDGTRISDYLALDYTDNLSLFFAYKNDEGDYVNIERSDLTIVPKHDGNYLAFGLVSNDDGTVGPRAIRGYLGEYEICATISGLKYQMGAEVREPMFAFYSVDNTAPKNYITEFRGSKDKNIFYLICEYHEGDELTLWLEDEDDRDLLEANADEYMEISEVIKAKEISKGHYEFTVDYDEMKEDEFSFSIIGENKYKDGGGWDCGTSFTVYKGGREISEENAKTASEEALKLVDKKITKTITDEPGYYLIDLEDDEKGYINIQLADSYSDEKWAMLNKTVLNFYDVETKQWICDWTGGGEVSLPKTTGNKCYVEIITGVKGFTAEMILSKYAQKTVTIQYDRNAGNVKYSQVNEYKATETYNEETGVAEFSVDMLCDFYDDNSRRIAFEVAPKSGKRCTGIFGGEEFTRMEDYKICYAHNFDITDQNGVLIPHNIDNMYGTSIPAKNFYCCTYIYSSRGENSGWEDVNEMIRVCKENGYMAKWKRSFVEWEAMMEANQTYKIIFDNIDTSKISGSEVAINSLNKNLGNMISEKVSATPEQEAAVEAYTGKEIVSVYELNVTGEGKSNENLGGVVQVSMPIEDSATGVVWLKESVEGNIIPVPMTTSVLNNCLIFETSHFSNYAIVKDKTVIAPTGGGTAPLPEEKPVTNDKTTGQTTAKVEPTTVNGQATAKVDDKTAKEIVNNAVDNKSKEVVISAESKTPATPSQTPVAAKVELPTDTVKDIVEKTDANIVVKTDAGTVELDQTAAEAVANKAGESEKVELVIETKVSEDNQVVIELKIETASGNVTNFNGGNAKVTVNIPKELEGKEVVCVYVDENGNYVKMKGQKNADNSYSFTTGHFSTYMILTEEEANAAIAEQQNSKITAGVKATALKAKSTAAKGKITVKWTKSKGYKVDYYQVFKATKKDGAYKYLAKTTKLQLVNKKGLKAGKTYYFKVRGVRMVDGAKVYTKWSTIAARKAK